MQFLFEILHCVWFKGFKTPFVLQIHKCSTLPQQIPYEKSPKIYTYVSMRVSVCRRVCLHILCVHFHSQPIYHSEPIPPQVTQKNIQKILCCAKLHSTFGCPFFPSLRSEKKKNRFVDPPRLNSPGARKISSLLSPV